MTEINQGIFCTLFQTCKNFKIQLFPVISTVIPVIEFPFSPCLKKKKMGLVKSEVDLIDKLILESVKKIF